MQPKLRVTPSSRAQERFWRSPARHRAFIGGIGSGKTLAGCVEVLRQPPGSVGFVIAPTYKMLRDASQATFFKLFRGFVEDHNKQEQRTTLINGTTILWRSADDPDSLRGPNLDWAWIDEASYCKAGLWNVVVGRLRGQPGRAWITTTPKGKNWVWGLCHARRVRLFRAATRDNTALPVEFLDDVAGQYGGQFAEQELGGQFVDWSGGMVTRADFRFLPLHQAPTRHILEARAWDLAFSTSRAADQTAGVRGWMDADRNLFLRRPVLGRWRSPQAKEVITTTALQDGPRVVVGVEAVASQRATYDDLKAEPRLYAHDLRALHPPADKAAAAAPWMSLAALGKVWLILEEGVDEAAWEPWIGEWTAFPPQDKDGHDDCVDAVSRLHEALTAQDRADFLGHFAQALRS